jgi:addiction module HigA family antidote
MHNPPHPGELLRLELLDEMGLSITAAAKKLGISRVPLSRVLNCRAAISEELALRLETMGISTAKTWIDMQTNYNLFHARQRLRPVLQALAATERRPS